MAAEAPCEDADESAAKKSRTEPTPLELMAKRNKGMHTEASIAVGRSFKPRPSDVFVVTYPKCGTTWVTQICHQLRTGGHMEFGEITQVCPWDIMAHDCGQDLDAEHVANPRVWKSHERAGDVAKGGKYIHVCRDPDDAFVSFYRFLPAWVALPPDAITPEEFASAVFGGVSHSGGIWDFFVEWWERREDANVLWVAFEDLKSDLEGQVRRIAKFMDIALTEEILQATLKNSSFAFMAENTKQFDEHFVFGKIRDSMMIPADYVFGDVTVSKVRAGGGSVGEGQKGLPPSVREMLASRWEKSVLPRTGFKSYAEMRAAIGKL